LKDWLYLNVWGQKWLMWVDWVNFKF